MNTLPAHEILARLFATVVEEAKKRPEFAASLLSAFPEAIVARIEKEPGKKKSGFDPSSIHAVNVLRQHGEETLRGRLQQIGTIKDLKAVASHSGIELPSSATRKGAKKADMIEGIIVGAKHYDSQRKAAAA
jgi:hypothetical protein